MLNSKCLVSSRSPLWVAAFCFKQLKKAQVFETEISSSIDKILQDEIDGVSYRVLAYLLLGVVRIYSKKVEYLLHDCNDVLIRINKFVMHTNDNARAETLRMSVTIPDIFELDAFDLDILEDADRDHIASQEEITLKDVLCKSVGFGQFSLDKFEEFDFCLNTCSANHLMVEDIRQSHLMDMDFEGFPPNSPINLLTDEDIFRNRVFSQKEPMNFDTVVVVEGLEKQSVNLFCQYQKINEDHSLEECIDLGESSIAEETLEELIEGSVEEHHSKGKLEFQDGKLSVIPPESKNLGATPQSKFRGGSVGKPKPGAITPEFMLISTPAVRERARFSRKRKTILDGKVVLPNEVLKKNIQDASDLISHRRKFRQTLLIAQRQSHISSLPNGFYKSVLPCYSLELQFLFSKKKIKIPDSLEIVEGLGKLDMPESQIVGSPKHIATDPQTPPQCPTIKRGSIEHPEREQALNRDEELNLIEELSSYESFEREQCMTKDDDLELVNEDINSFEAENSELLAGWSARTSKVARHLHGRFMDQKEEEVVNFSQVLGGRARKECARLFYEILVLKTTSYVDVEQKNAHGDIAISKLPKLDQTFATNGL